MSTCPLLCLFHSSICYVGTLRDALHHVLANTKPLGISFLMHSSQVAIVTPRPVGCREVAIGGERRKRCYTWTQAVSRQLHGAFSFSMTSPARHGAFGAMGQAVIHVLISYGWLVDRRTGDSGVVEGGNFG